MKILIVGTTYAPAFNGQAIFTVNLAENLVKRGHVVTVVTPSGKGRAYQILRNNVRVEGIAALTLGFVHNDSQVSFFSGPALRKIIRDFQPDIVHIQDHYPLCRAAVQIARENDIRLIGTNHFMPENLAPYIPFLPKIKPVFDWILWNWVLEVYNRLDVATAQSKISAALLRKAGLRIPIFHASCGLDVSRFYPDPGIDRAGFRLRYGLDPVKKVFLFVGRVDGEKRIDILIRAMRHLKRDDIQLAIAGKGAAFDSLNALAQELNLGERVRFIGYVPNEDLPPLLNSVDIFTMPSDAELLSIASLEAMACGRPVLLANAVALPELVSEGVNGYLFKPGDPADAARKMSLLADCSERWPEMGKASQEKARFHGLENTVSQYLRIYETMLSHQSVPDAQPLEHFV